VVVPFLVVALALWPHWRRVPPVSHRTWAQWLQEAETDSAPRQLVSTATLLRVRIGGPGALWPRTALAGKHHGPRHRTHAMRREPSCS